MLALSNVNPTKVSETRNGVKQRTVCKTEKGVVNVNLEEYALKLVKTARSLSRV